MKYLNLLGLHQFSNFLNDNGILLMDLDKSENLQEEIENPERKSIILRLLDLKNNSKSSMLEGFMYKCFKSSINPSYVNSHLKLYEVDDFVIYPILTENEKITERDKAIQGLYHEFMCEQFKNTEYKNDYDRYVSVSKDDTMEKSK